MVTQKSIFERQAAKFNLITEIETNNDIYSRIFGTTALVLAHLFLKFDCSVDNTKPLNTTNLRGNRYIKKKLKVMSLNLFITKVTIILA